MCLLNAHARNARCLRVDLGFLVTNFNQDSVTAESAEESGDRKCGFLNNTDGYLRYSILKVDSVNIRCGRKCSL